MPKFPGASNKARNMNIKAEIASGKKPAQAAAIGYSEQRQAAKKAGGKPAPKVRSGSALWNQGGGAWESDSAGTEMKMGMGKRKGKMR